MATPDHRAQADGLCQRFALSSTVLDVAERRLQLTHPRSVEDLISDELLERDPRLPYWGAIWPSARVLSDRIAAETGRGRRLLELGCGLGTASLAAGLAGFEVLATDYYCEALEFVAENARRNDVAGIRTRLVDWREFPSELRDFDYVVASDVLYDRGNSGLVAAAFAQSLAPDGIGLLTDPGRSVARAFAAECRDHGLHCECVDLYPAVAGAAESLIELFEIRRMP